MNFCSITTQAGDAQVHCFREERKNWTYSSKVNTRDMIIIIIRKCRIKGQNAPKANFNVNKKVALMLDIRALLLR